MEATKVIWSLIGNSLGIGVTLLGIMNFGSDWKANIVFALAIIFFTIKIGIGILELIKKKYSLMKKYLTLDND